MYDATTVASSPSPNLATLILLKNRLTKSLIAGHDASGFTFDFESSVLNQSLLYGFTFDFGFVGNDANDSTEESMVLLLILDMWF